MTKIPYLTIGIGVATAGMLLGYTIVWVLWVDIEAYRFATLAHHNYLRARHGSAPLSLNLDLCNLAMMCARYYANSKRVDHSCPYHPQGKTFYFTEGIGENLWGPANTFSHYDAAVGATRRFYQEIDTYNFSDVKSNFHKFFVVGHITQILWRQTRQVGIGVASDSKRVYVVAFYYPSGNLWEENMEAVEQNVGPPLKDVPPIHIYGRWGWRFENDTREALAAENKYLLTPFPP
ncbi:unnamed protein product [Orchesella dallaii]|uniref:SCP domain-containing protein n=1 Tax=Orchesella dallaii TaxID=48710 RepID=A0ABP1RZC5_9HEXA